MRSRQALLIAALLGSTLAAALMWRRLTTSPWLSLPGPSSSAAESPTRPTATAAATAAETAQPAAPSPAAGEQRCPAGMVLVAGIHCPFVAHRCAEHAPVAADASPQVRHAPRYARPCARYRNELVCEGRPFELSFCIDRFEYPNLRGVLPAIMVDYHEAARACAIEGKRLCEADEWILACEGLKRLPFPYGLRRDPQACNIDQGYLEPDLRALAIPSQASVEIERIDRRSPSGAFTRCVSPLGVHDMTGNVEEWVHNREGSPSRRPFESALMGGAWEPGQASCRAMSTDYNGWHRSYRAGFRCCRNTLDGKRARRAMPANFRLQRRQRIDP